MCKWNRDMVGIMTALSHKGLHLTTNYIPAALIALAEQECVEITHKVRLTAHGRHVLRIITATMKVANEG